MKVRWTERESLYPQQDLTPHLCSLPGSQDHKHMFTSIFRLTREPNPQSFIWIWLCWSRALWLHCQASPWPPFFITGSIPSPATELSPFKYSLEPTILLSHPFLRTEVQSLCRYSKILCSVNTCASIRALSPFFPSPQISLPSCSIQGPLRWEDAFLISQWKWTSPPSMPTHLCYTSIVFFRPWASASHTCQLGKPSTSFSSVF